LGLKKKGYESGDRLTEFFLDVELKGEALTESVISKIETAKNEDKKIQPFYIYFDEFRQVANALDWEKIRQSSNRNRFVYKY